ncbi:oligosaccharide flippase family protein [Pseudomonas sp. Marseille-QA0892]
MKKLNELSKIVFVVVPMALQPVLAFVLLVLVAHMAPQEAYGALALSMVMMTFLVGFADLGLRDFLLSRPAIEAGLSKGENLVYPSVTGFITLASIILYYLHVHAPGMAPHLFVALLPEALALAVLQRALFFHYQTQDRLVGFSTVDALFKSAPFLIKILLFWRTGDLVGSVLAGSVLTLLLYAGWFYNNCVRPGTFFSKSASYKSALTAMAARWGAWLPFTLSFLSFFLYFGFDRILVEAILGAEPLAIYAAACSFITIGQIVVQGFWSLYMPKISRGNIEATQGKFVMFGFGLSLAMVIGYQVFAGFFFHLLYPESYAQAADLLSIMSLYFIFRLVNVVFEMYWVAKNRYSLFVKVRIACGLLSIALNYLFLGHYGLMAPAIVLVACEMLITLFLLAHEFKGSRTTLIASP